MRTDKLKNLHKEERKERDKESTIFANGRSGRSHGGEEREKQKRMRHRHNPSCSAQLLQLKPLFEQVGGDRCSPYDRVPYPWRV